MKIISISYTNKDDINFYRDFHVSIYNKIIYT